MSKDKFPHRPHKHFRVLRTSHDASRLQLQRQLEISQALWTISKALNETLDLETIFQLVVDTAAQFIPNAEGAVLHRLNGSGALGPVAVSGQIASGKGPVLLAIGRGAAGLALLQGALVNVPDVLTDARVLPPSDGNNMRSLLVAPLRSQARNLGTLSVISAHPAAFSTEDERLLEGLANQAAVAIQNAKLYEDERLQRSLVEMLAQGAVVINRRLDLNVVLDEILDQIMQVVPCRFANIMLIEDDHLHMARYRTRRMETGIFHRPPELLPLAMPSWQQMLQTRSPLLISDTRQDPMWKPLETGDWARSYLGLPLQIGNEVIGFLNLNEDYPEAFSSQYAKALISFAAHAAIAIHNARLYQELQRALTQERNMRDQLVRADRLASMGRLTASLAHEINNPLQGISLCLERIGFYTGQPGKQREYVGRAESEVNRLAQMVRQILDYQSPTQEEKSLVDLRQLEADVLLLSQKRLQRARVQVVHSWEPGLPRIEARPAQLKQVLLNLVLNSLEAMPDGGQLSIRGYCLEQEPEWLRLEVSDNGAGIDAKDLEHIYEPFYSTKSTGTGLGLWVSHSIVIAHAGRMAVESSPGKGTTVRVWLPVPTSRSDNDNQRQNTDRR